MIHHGFKKGKRVYVRLISGSEIVDKFVDSSSKYLTLENHKIQWDNISCTSINKNRTMVNDKGDLNENN